jgi:capsular exopolysaccharide synthesis family protein
MNSIENIEKRQEQINLKQEVLKYLPYWYWFVISIIVALIGAAFYLRYQNNVYESKTIIKLLDDTNSDFKMPTNGVNFFLRNKVNIENEKEIIKSNRLLEKVVGELQLYNVFSEEGKIRTNEVYGNATPVVKWIGEEEKVNSFFGNWTLTIDQAGYYWDGDSKRRAYNTIYDIDGIAMQVSKPIEPIKNKRVLKLRKLMLADAVAALKNNLQVNLIGEESELLEIKTTGSIIEKNNAILNKLNEVFDRDGREDKQRIFRKTIDFVNSRFDYLFKELDTIELNKANYKRNQKLSFIEGDSQMLLATKTETSAEYERAKTQSLLSDIIIKALREVKFNELLPANIGLDEMNVNELIKQYNEIVLQSQKIIKTAGENHPKVQQLIGMQMNLKENIKYSLKAYQSVLTARIQEIDRVKEQQEFQYGALPYQEKMIRSIERQQKIKETLYLLLLQKREEASINLAIVNPSIKIVDPAIANKVPLSPKRSVTFLLAFFGGLFIPFSVFFVYYLFDNKIHTRETIESQLDGISIVAEIPNIPERDKFVKANDRSVLSEAFRILIANLNFVLPPDLNKTPIIFVASSIKGEGKTFTSNNLALTLASLGKKVVLVGADLRNPQIHKSLKVKRGTVGLVNYLIDTDFVYKDCISTVSVNNINLDVIFSGEIPPNPSEIISNGRFGVILEELRKDYEYVIVDTAPTLLVADTTLISKYADLTLYLIKANHTEKGVLKYINTLNQQMKIKNVSIVFNNIGENEGYGKGYAYSYKYNYGYGYGYDSSSVILSNWFKFKRTIKDLIPFKRRR